MLCRSWRTIVGMRQLLLIVAVVSLLGANLLYNAPQIQAADNLIPNSSVEIASANPGLPEQWQTGYIWGDLDANYQYLTTGFNSNRSVNVTVSRYATGDAKWYFNAVSVQPNQAYIFSDSYISTTTTRVLAAVTLTDTSTQYLSLGSAPVSSSWAPFTGSFVAPANAVSASVFHVISSVGSLTTDNFSLTATSSHFNRPLVSLTFDDGWASQYTAGWPVVGQFNFKATYYIISGKVGATASGYMSLTQVKALATAGNEIGSHTVSHPDLTTLPLKKLDSELSQSLSYLRRNVTPTITDFAYPYGAYNALTTREVKKYYSSARTSDVGLNTKAGFDAYRIQSEYVTPQTTLADFQGWLTTAQNQHAWLVVMYHQVDNSGSDYAVTPSMLTAQLQALQNSGLPVTTVNQALSELKTQL